MNLYRKSYNYFDTNIWTIYIATVSYSSSHSRHKIMSSSLSWCLTWCLPHCLTCRRYLTKNLSLHTKNTNAVEHIPIIVKDIISSNMINTFRTNFKLYFCIEIVIIYSNTNLWCFKNWFVKLILDDKRHCCNTKYKS